MLISEDKLPDLRLVASDTPDEDSDEDDDDSAVERYADTVVRELPELALTVVPLPDVVFAPFELVG